MSKSKITSSHSTAIPAAEALADTMQSLQETVRISFGIINQCKPIRGNRRIKICLDSGAYLVKVRDIGSTQDVRFYSSSEGYDQLIRDAATRLGYDVQGD